MGENNWIEQQKQREELEKERERFANSDRLQSFLLGYWDGKGSAFNSFGSPSYLAGWVAGGSDSRLEQLKSQIPKKSPNPMWLESPSSIYQHSRTPKFVFEERTSQNSYYWPRSEKGDLIAGLILASSPFLFAIGIGIYHGIKKLFE